MKVRSRSLYSISRFSKNIMAMVMGVANWYSFDRNIASPSLSQFGMKAGLVLRASSTWTSSWRSVPRKSARAPRRRGDFTAMSPRSGSATPLTCPGMNPGVRR